VPGQIHAFAMQVLGKMHDREACYMNENLLYGV